jgi:hypothetical protein
MNLPNFSAKKKGEGIMNQTLRDLTAARDLLVKDGWCRHYLYEFETGRHCAVGAIVEVTGVPIADAFFDRDAAFVSPRVNAALVALHEHLPAEDRSWSPPFYSENVVWDQIANYNNGTFEGSVLDLFNNTIAALTEVRVPDKEEELV